MKTKLLRGLVIAIALSTLLLMPGTFADDYDESNGSAIVGNATPTVSDPMLLTAAEADANNTNLNVWTEYRSNCSVTENNQLYDLRNVTWIIWEDSEADEGDADSNFNHYTLAYLNSTNDFDEIGPDGAGNSHLISGSCTKPADRSATTGTYKLAFKLHKTAAYTATKTWTIKTIVYDDANATSNVQTLIFGVNAYDEITITDTSHVWSGLAAGQNNATLTTPGDGNIDVVVTSNHAFKLQAKGSGDLASDGNTIPLGNVLIHKDTLADAVALTTDYADVVGLTGQTRGEDQAKSITLWISVPEGTPSGTYTYTLSVQALAG